MKKMLLAAMMTILTTGCLPAAISGPKPSMDNYRAALQSWEGAHIDDLLLKWGATKGVEQQLDGTTLYTFSRSEEVYLQEEMAYNHAHQDWDVKSPARLVHYVCRTRFRTNEEGIIISVAPGGFDCGQLSPPPSRPQQ